MGELGLMSPPAVESPPNGAACLESMRLLEASPPAAGSPSSPRDLPEPRVTSEHTNNRIGESADLAVLVWSGLRGQGELGTGPWAPDGSQRPWTRKAERGRGVGSPAGPHE